MRMTRALIVIGVAMMSVVTSISPTYAADGHCGVGYARSSTCTSGEVGDGEVEVHATTSTSSSAQVQNEAGTSAPPAREASPSAPTDSPPVPRGRLAADVDVPCQPGARLFGAGLCTDGGHAFLPPATGPAKPADPAPAAPVTPGVSLADVAQFVPRSASIRSQPNGWALVGAPVNFLTDATAQVVDGTLLGRPAQVRFVPVSFTWDHGDGTTSTTAGPGASWKQLGQQDFTSTDTSHTYPSIGDRRVAVTIAYSPSYRFDGGGWQQIPGTLPVVIGPVTIHVLQGSTVLVGGACGTRNAGPGC
ncbi:hypothetical protein [Clavibacter sp. Sh2088]|uniref:hypothetical protein n=1 Tax=Clavibacter sp. Sh2088 TaxID=3397676 RepID=UPI0039DF4AC5